MKTGSILSLIAGVLILAYSMIVLAMVSTGIPMMMSAMTGLGMPYEILYVFASLGVLSGFLVLAGFYLSLKPKTSQTGGILIIVFSALAFISGGGFIIGSILGIIGGALILGSKK